jgi:hypothetical protein
VTERATSSSAGVAAFRGAVDKAPLGISQSAVGRVGPAGGLHRRQSVPGPLHGDRVGDPRRRSHAAPVTSPTCSALGPVRSTGPEPSEPERPPDRRPPAGRRSRSLTCSVLPAANNRRRLSSPIPPVPVRASR